LKNFHLIKEIASIENDVKTLDAFSRYERALQNFEPKDKATALLLSEVKNPLDCPAYCFELFEKHKINVIEDPVAGRSYLYTNEETGVKLPVPVKLYGERKALCIAILGEKGRLN
tara:strand:+ start:1622 stop:1966 length:345 start_codon:yes stop_codon:yes gene_type:complete